MKFSRFMVGFVAPMLFSLFHTTLYNIIIIIIDTCLYYFTGQFYTLYLKGNSNLQLPPRVKTVLALTFFEEADKRVEFSRWQYWYNMQPNPNQKAFDIGERSLCFGSAIASFIEEVIIQLGASWHCKLQLGTVETGETKRNSRLVVGLGVKLWVVLGLG